MILIDIPKPKRCLYCPMIDYNHDACIVRPTHVGEQISQLAGRPSWCPIVAECDLGGAEKLWENPEMIKHEEETPEEAK